MDIFICIISWIGIFFLYSLTEFVINLFFTYKISYVAKNDFQRAAIAGSISTFLFMFSTLLAILLATNEEVFKVLFINEINDDSIKLWMQIIYLFVTTCAFAIGNFLATISIPKLSKRKEKKKNEEK